MTKLNRDEILRGLLQTLVDGWGRSSVQSALDRINSTGDVPKRGRMNPSEELQSLSAVDLIPELNLSPDRRAILTELAMRFDKGSAFPKMGDVRSFLLSHHRNGTDLKGRVPAFKRMLPVLVDMSPKGLERLLARSHHSGPAELGAISDAIKGAGESLRGSGPSAIEPSGAPAPKTDEAEPQPDTPQSRSSTS